MKTRLQELRKNAGFKSAKSFADHIGMSIQTYNNYEQGRRTMSAVTAWQIADGLGCSIDYLLGRDFKEKNDCEYVTLSKEQVDTILKALDGTD